MTGGTETPDAPIGYIRGAASPDIDTRRVTRVVLSLWLVSLAVLVAILSVAAVRANSRLSGLQQHGVPVEVTVSGCLGMASGTGITATGYQCRGTFTLGGHEFNDVIGGSNDLRAPGSKLFAITDPDHPAILSTPDAVTSPQRSWTAFISPAVALVLLVVSGSLILWRTRRGRKPGLTWFRRSRGASASG